MRTIDPDVAYCMQNNMNCFTRVAIVKRAFNGVLEHTCGLLCVYREILDSVRITHFTQWKELITSVTTEAKSYIDIIFCHKINSRTSALGLTLWLSADSVTNWLYFVSAETWSEF